MKLPVRTLCLVAILGGSLSWAGAADEKAELKDALALQSAMEKAIEKVQPSVACILVARGKDSSTFTPESPDFVPESYGSGVVIDEKGLILTNEHVVRGATSLYVRLPGCKGCNAKLLASDERSDLAVIQLDKEGLKLKPIPLGDGGKARKGQFVLSVANPFATGFEDGSPSASWGIISNLRRRGPLRPQGDKKLIGETDFVKPLHYYGTLIQTDARLNLGCSGGALINLKGELIGLTTALAALGGSETPGGFALPIDAGMKRIIDKLKKGEEVEYGFLGVQFPGLEERRGEGVRILSAIPGGPAFKANIEGGSCILAINGVPVQTYNECYVLIGTQLAGTTVRIEWRTNGGATRAEDVTLAKSFVPSNKFYASRKPRSVSGLRVDYASVLASSRLDRYGIPAGVVIREVIRESPADKAGFQVNKVIKSVNGRPVNSPAEFYREVDKAGDTIELTLAGREDKYRLTK
jgi:S1-C subfamily serine protease